jgi:hypothetical protein
MLGAKVKHKSQPLSGVVVNAYMNHTFMAVMYDVIQEDGTMASIHNSDIGGVELAEQKQMVVNVAAPVTATSPASVSDPQPERTETPKAGNANKATGQR